MPIPFDRVAQKDTEGFADILRKHGTGSKEHIKAVQKGAIFEDVIFGEIKWDHADHPNVSDMAKAFTVSAGIVQTTPHDLNGKTHDVDAPIYNPHWWKRTDQAGHPFISFLIADVGELIKTFVVVQFAESVEWTSYAGTPSNLRLVDPRRQFFKEKGAQFLHFDATRD